MIARRLRKAGIVGMNHRNRELVQRLNPRRLLPAVDDKIHSKALCLAAGVAAPAQLGVVRAHHELAGLGERLARQRDFVVKPARGAQGNGILVVHGRRGDDFVVSGGRTLAPRDLRHRVSEILSGLYSLGGQEDAALFEERLGVHPDLAELCHDGVPDVRVLVYRGVPVMAMVRLPTHRSRGRANLHQGAIGAGVDLASGRLCAAIWRDRAIERHPDTGAKVLGHELPQFGHAMLQAVRAADCTGLGYIGVDLVIDAQRGPVVLELNARPGLSIQLANAGGLQPRLTRAARVAKPDLPAERRVELGRQLAAAH